MTEPRFDTDFQRQLDNLLTWRRDVRHFKTEALPPGVVETLLDCAARGPSVGNSQPWRFVQVHSAQRRASIIAHVEAENARAALIYSGEQRTAYTALKLNGLREAPEHIAVYSDTAPVAGSGLGRQTMSQTLVYSTVLAIHTIWLAARARGIGLGWVSILDPETVSAVLDVPCTWTFVGYLCLGYPTDEHDVPELDRKGWQPRIDPAQTRFVR